MVDFTKVTPYFCHILVSTLSGMSTQACGMYQEAGSNFTAANYKFSGES